MKKLLFAVLVLATFSVFAQSATASATVTNRYMSTTTPVNLAGWKTCNVYISFRIQTYGYGVTINPLAPVGSGQIYRAYYSTPITEVYQPTYDITGDNRVVYVSATALLDDQASWGNNVATINYNLTDRELDK